MMGFMPLLHVGQPDLRATVIDFRTTGISAGVFVLVLAAIWQPAWPSAAVVLRRRLVRSIGRRLLFLFVVAAVLPAVLPYDHLIVPAHLDDDAHEAVHVAHCHVSPATCSDAPMSAGLGQFLHADPLVLVPAMLAILLLAALTVPSTTYGRPEPRPPMALATA